MGMSVEELKDRLAAKKLGIDIAGLTPAQIQKAVEAKKGLVQIVEATPAATKAALEPAPTDAPKFVPPTGRTFTAPPVSAGHNGVVPPSAGTPEAQGVPEGNHPAPTPAPVEAPKAPAKPRGRPAKAPEASAPTTPPSWPRKFKLLVNTFEQRGLAGPAVMCLSDLLAPVHAAIKEAHGVPHYMAIDYKGRAVFAEALDQYLATNPLDGDDRLFVDARTAEGADALPILERHAGEIYRGV